MLMILREEAASDLAGNANQRTAGRRTAQPSLLAGMLFDGDSNRMTPSHAVKKGTRYRYYVSRPLISKDQPDGSAGRRIPAAEIEHLVASRVRQWLLDPGGIYKAISAWLPEPSAQQMLVSRAAEIGRQLSAWPPARTRTVLTALIERVEVSVDQVDIHLRPTGLTAFFDVAVPSQSMLEEETLILSVPARLRRAGMEIRMLIDGTDPFAVAKPNARLIKLLVRAHRFNTILVQSDGVAFAAAVMREGVSRSYFTRVVRLSYLAPDITQAILDGRQPRDLTAQKLLAHSRLPLGWHDQRTALGFA
jgi:site-specific DNA recombinase